MRDVLFRACLALSARGGFSRYAVESLVTPTLYRSFRDNASWESLLVQTLHESKRPALLLEQMERNIRLRNIARRRYLASHHLFPSQASDLLLRKDRPPTKREISSIFPDTARFIHRGDDDVVRRKLVQEAKVVKNGMNLQHWGIKEVLECTGSCVDGTSPFNSFCEREGVYDLYSDEYISALANHLRKRRFILEVRFLPNETLTLTHG